MIKIVIIGIVVLFLCIVLGRSRPEYALLVAIGGAVIIFAFGIEKMKEVIALCHEMEEYIGIDSSYITILLKMIGIAYIAEFSCALCKDAGQMAVAGQIDFAGKITMIVLSLPILQSLLTTMIEYFPGGGTP